MLDIVNASEEDWGIHEEGRGQLDLWIQEGLMKKATPEHGE